MTIRDALTYADEQARNEISEEKKLLWLASLDGKILAEVVNTHNMTIDANTWINYIKDADNELDLSDNLVMAYPFDEVYINYLLAKICTAVSDIARANNEYALFTEGYESYKSFINRTFLPLQNYTVG